MFNSITGLLTGRGTDSIWVRTSGVEWDISVPGRAIDEFGSLGSETTVYTWLHHYEDGMRLFGFPSRSERVHFLALMKVEGIGPKQALKILSGISPSDLGAALDAGDLATLQRIPGVGPKMAQKMVLALKGRLVEASPEMLKKGAPGGEWADLVRAFVDMGFDRKSAEAAVREKVAGLPSGPDRERELFRRVLMELSAGGSK